MKKATGGQKRTVQARADVNWPLAIIISVILVIDVALIVIAYAAVYHNFFGGMPT
jgi:hypothetical protein